MRHHSSGGEIDRQSSKVNPLSNLVCTNGLIPDYITLKDLVILQVVDLDITI